MPARSVVIKGVRKRSEAGFRRLSLNELTQMAGRAGRRGIDPEGKCLIALDSPEAEEEVRQLLAGTPEPIVSRFRVSYSSAALLVDLYREPAEVRRLIESSFGQFQNRAQMARLEAERSALLETLGAAEGLESPCCTLRDLLLYRERRAALEAERLRIQQQGLGKRRGGRRAGKAEAQGWAATENLHEARRRVEAMALALSECSCHRCPHRAMREQKLKRSTRIRQAMDSCGERLRLLRDSYWEQCVRVIAVLERFGYLEGAALSPEGRLIASLRHDNELLVARVAFSGLLEGLSPPETAALLSCLVEEPRETENPYARQLLKRQAHLKRRLQALESLAEEVRRVQGQERIDRPVAMHTTYLAATYQWVAGEEDWVRLIERGFGGHEGDLIRAFRRLLDLCRQLQESPELPEALRGTIAAAVAGLDRGIVLESALI